MYKLSGPDSIIRLSDGACIPRDVENIDYQRFLEWESEGNAPLPTDPPPPPTRDEVDAAAARVDAAIAFIASRTPAQARAWAAANFPTLTGAEADRLGTMAAILCIVARRI